MHWLAVMSVLLLTPAVAGAEVLYDLEWGQVVERTGERPRVQVLTCDDTLGATDCAVVVTYTNVLTSQADLEIEIETPVGTLGVAVEPRKGWATDTLTVTPPPGFIADPPSIDVGEGGTGDIVVRPMVLGEDRLATKPPRAKSASMEGVHPTQD